MDIYQEYQKVAEQHRRVIRSALVDIFAVQAGAVPCVIGKRLLFGVLVEYPHDAIDVLAKSIPNVMVVKAAEVAQKLGNTRAQNKRQLIRYFLSYHSPTFSIAPNLHICWHRPQPVQDAGSAITARPSWKAIAGQVALVRATGISEDRIRIVDPLDLDAMQAALDAAIEVSGPFIIMPRALRESPCIFRA